MRRRRNEPEPPSWTEEQNETWDRCRQDTAYFVSECCLIFNATRRRWVPFRLWASQREVLQALDEFDYLLILKARQLGLTWLVLCHLLADMLFRPSATILIFSKRDDEARLLLQRLKDVHDRLPDWMKQPIGQNNEHHWAMENGSSAHAFPSTGGRSYTASHVLLDEADFMPDFGSVLNAVQPTVDAGGKMIMISTSDKVHPGSTFKNMYEAARKGETDHKPIFLPWYARPSRTEEWYQKRVAESLAKDGTLDSVHSEYPSTEEEALASLSLNKRLTPGWLSTSYEARSPLHQGQVFLYTLPTLPGLRVFIAPVKGIKYVLGADPAEGNPSSDDSAICVMEVATGEQVAVLQGKFEPEVFAGHIDALSKFYNHAPVMVERNNHGHSVLLALLHNQNTRRLFGRDKKVGWLSNVLGKTLMYDAVAETLRDNALSEERRALIHDRETYLQLASIEGATLKAPDGFMDDLADAYALAEVGRAFAVTEPEGQARSYSQVNLS